MKKALDYINKLVSRIVWWAYINLTAKARRAAGDMELSELNNCDAEVLEIYHNESTREYAYKMLVQLNDSSTRRIIYNTRTAFKIGQIVKLSDFNTNNSYVHLCSLNLYDEDVNV